eukprot:145467-Pleurochrysis_carterae.AAC.2
MHMHLYLQPRALRPVPCALRPASYALRLRAALGALSTRVYACEGEASKHPHEASEHQRRLPRACRMHSLMLPALVLHVSAVKACVPFGLP